MVQNFAVILQLQGEPIKVGLIWIPKEEPVDKDGFSSFLVFDFESRLLKLAAGSKDVRREGAPSGAFRQSTSKRAVP